MARIHTIFHTINDRPMKKYGPEKVKACDMLKNKIFDLIFQKRACPANFQNTFIPLILSVLGLQGVYLAQ